MRSTHAYTLAVVMVLAVGTVYRSVVVSNYSTVSRPRVSWDEAQRLLLPRQGEGQQPQPQQTHPQPQQQLLATTQASSVISQAQIDAVVQPATAVQPKPPAELPAWLTGATTALAFNGAARQTLANISPRGTTVHFTFGTSVMMDFVKNWLHFVKKAGLTPHLVGAADLTLLKACDGLAAPAAGIIPELDVWTYKRKPKRAELYEMKSDWGYIRHHKSDFLEMGLVKVAFLWELLGIGFHVLISDLDVVWLNGHWQRWMTHAEHSLGAPAVPEATYIAAADVLVTTDELDTKRDESGAMASELNTGVVYFRATLGGKAMVQSWRKAMLAQKGRPDLTENVNDQSLFNQVVRGRALQDYGGWVHSLRMQNVSLPPTGFDGAPRNARHVHQSHGNHEPCLPGDGCAPVAFTYGTLPIRPYTSGHTWFNQNVQQMEGHELPQFEPITVHFTFQFGDTKDYPHGKRQRAREAALWAVDPPAYFEEGIFVALDGPTYDEEAKAAVYKRFPEWSPQRHMFMDAPQRQAVRDLLGLATAVGGIVVLPKFWCHCDRYWNALHRCRMPMLQGMALPFNCPMDSLYLTNRWNEKNVKFREHTFLENPNVPAALKENTVRVTVAAQGVAVNAAATTPNHVELPYGTAMADVKAMVLKANPNVHVIKMANADLRRLCRWLGSTKQQDDFNRLTMYILTESSRYCPTEDTGGNFVGGFNWQNPFHGINCTWGFHAPTTFPLQKPQCATGEGVALVERSNSTTCPRQMLCDYFTLPDGREPKPITWCNIEGYNGMSPAFLPTTKRMLSEMPGGRCPYPPGDVVGVPSHMYQKHGGGGERQGISTILEGGGGIFG